MQEEHCINISTLFYRTYRTFSKFLQVLSRERPSAILGSTSDVTLACLGTEPASTRQWKEPVIAILLLLHILKSVLSIKPKG